LIVGLHSINENEDELFEGTHLAQQAAARGWIVVCPYGRGDTGFSLSGEKDVLDVIAILERDLPVDTTRLFALGAGMGGTGAWLLSLRHPNLFAAAAVVSAYSDMDQQDFYRVLGYHSRELFHYETMNPIRLVRPGLRTQYRVIHANEDPVVPGAHAGAMHKKLLEYAVSSELVVESGEMHGEALLEKHLSDTMDFFAAVTSGTNGDINQQWFGGSGGPLAAVFARGPFTIVYGTQSLPPGTPEVGQERRAGQSVTGPAADLRTAEQFAMEWQSIFAGQPRLLADTQVTSALQADHNLVLVGDPRTNAVLRELVEGLPIEYDGDQFAIAGNRYSFAENGVVFAAPHPKYPGRTVVVVSGMGERLGNFEKSLLKLGTDYIVTDDQHRFVDLGPFDQFVIPRTPRGG
jgi:pimeloyl-ACP methyl ester carboxylesterase